MRFPAFTQATSRLHLIGALFTALALAGCAGQGASPLSQPSQNPTQADAQRQAQGRNVARAPSQLQLGFGETAHQPSDAAAKDAPGTGDKPAPLRALVEPKSFLGTIPCQSGNCEAARISLTFAPDGQWRARITPLDGGQQPTTAQGCWDVVSQQPARIILRLENDAILANLGFLNDNVLRVNLIHGVQPTLEYRLTRQAEIDPINELAGQALPVCAP